MAPALQQLGTDPFACASLFEITGRLLEAKARADLLPKAVQSEILSFNRNCWMERVDQALEKGAKASDKLVNERASQMGA